MTLPKSIPVAPTAASLAGKAEAKAESRAWRDAMKHIARDIPDPDAYARLMPLAHAEMLLTAVMRRDGWSVHPACAERLRPFGLVEYGGTALTVFGVAVRKALLKENA